MTGGGHGGRRPGAGRPARGGEAAELRIPVRLTEAEKAELVDGLVEGESLSALLLKAGLAEVRRRRTRS